MKSRRKRWGHPRSELRVAVNAGVSSGLAGRLCCVLSHHLQRPYRPPVPSCRQSSTRSDISAVIPERPGLAWVPHQSCRRHSGRGGAAQRPGAVCLRGSVGGSQHAHGLPSRGPKPTGRLTRCQEFSRWLACLFQVNVQKARAKSFFSTQDPLFELFLEKVCEGWAQPSFMGFEDSVLLKPGRGRRKSSWSPGQGHSIHRQSAEPRCPLLPVCRGLLRPPVPLALGRAEGTGQRKGGRARQSPGAAICPKAAAQREQLNQHFFFTLF